MIISLDFDDTIVEQSGEYADVTTPLRFKPGALSALRALKRAGHTLIIFSGRASRALRVDAQLDPLVRSGKKRFSQARWDKSQPVNEARYQQMLSFVANNLTDIIDAVDDGVQGKPSADVFIDDRALRYGHGAGAMSWATIGHVYGEPDYSQQQHKETA